MTHRQACALLLVALAPALLTWAQSQAPGAIPNRRPAANSKTAAKAVKPDPDLLDGSIYDAEKRPLYGMISEVELPGSEQKSERVGGQPQPAGPQGPQASASIPKLPTEGSSAPQQQQQQAATPPPIQSGQDDREQQSEGNQAQASGVQAQNLEGQGGAPDPNEQSKPKDMQIGDATLQIQTLPQNQQQVVGTESTSTQQYEKKVPPGQQTDNRNRGVEKGKVMPKGI